jgi:hypothetical protein
MIIRETTRTGSVNSALSGGVIGQCQPLALALMVLLFQNQNDLRGSVASSVMKDGVIPICHALFKDRFADCHNYCSIGTGFIRLF